MAESVKQNLSQKKIVKKLTGNNAINYSTSSDFPEYDYQGRKVKKFTCLCGDCFLFKSSLKDHLCRRSVKITCIKSTDSSKINFYNRCALLTHLQNCSNHDQFKSISFSPLMDNKTTKWFTKSKFSLTNLDLKNEIINSSDSQISCAECGAKLCSLDSGKHHFSSTNLNSKPIQCKICLLWIPNNCSFKAHQRLHTAFSPFICPECGLCNSKSFHKYLLHTLFHCSHFSRQLFYICPNCSQTFKTISSLIEHITSFHTQYLLECSACKEKFDSDDKFETHASKHDQRVKARKDIIFKCSTCFSEISSKIYYFAHLESHLNQIDNLTQFGFKCFDCQDKIFSSSQEAALHLQADHASQIKINEKLKDICLRHKIKLTDQVKNKIKSNDFLDKLNCNICEFKAKNFDELMKHGINNYIKKGLLVCLICSNKPFNQQSKLLLHFKQSHSQLTKCPDSNCESIRFTNAEEVFNHLRVKHQIGENSIDQANAFKVKKAKLETQLLILDDNVRENNNENDSFTWLTKTSNQIELLSCSQCSFKCECQLKLQNHYLSHRTIKAPYLCLKCGNSFVTFLSLECHLLSEHSISDSKNYLKNYFPDLYKHHFDQEDIDLLEIIYDQQSTVSICPICFKSCSDSVDLKSHVKVHGMAFIKSCQKISLQQSKTNIDY